MAGPPTGGRQGTAQGVPADPVGAPEAPYDESQAAEDVRTVEHARGDAYAQARARLDASPHLAATAILARLGALDLDAAGRQRLLSMLSGYGVAELAPLLIDQLTAAMRTGGDVALWIAMIERQGAWAFDPLLDRVRDASLSVEDRERLLLLAVDLGEGAQAVQLVAVLGTGDARLAAALRRGLGRRARVDRDFCAQLVVALAQELRPGPLPGDPLQAGLHAAGVLSLWASVADGPSEALDASALTFTRDESAPVVARVAALRALRRDEATRGAHADTLAQLAARWLSAPTRDAQAAEILGLEALLSLPPERARTLVETTRLLDSDRPRLRAAALAHAPASAVSTAALLAIIDDDPWPSVKAHALARVDTPCTKRQVDRLGELATVRVSQARSPGGVAPRPRGPSDDGVVSRQAAAALGRCADAHALDWLAALIAEPTVDPLSRADAARALLSADLERGVQSIVAALEQSKPALAEALAAAIGESAPRSAVLVDALCRARRGLPSARAELDRAIARVSRAFEQGGQPAPRCDG